MITVLPQVGSTNAEVAARLKSGAMAEGDWLVADRQDAGRGRQGRTWFDGAGNFMGSTVVHLRAGDPQPASLALLAGLALAEAVQPILPPPHRLTLKWPNDLMIGTAKLAGILLERKGEGVIVGIGVNLAAAPQVPGRQTVALSAFGPAPDRDTFAQALARSFATELERWRSFGLEPLLRRWCALAHAEGTPLIVGDAHGGAISGLFAGLSADGALQLRLPDGTTRTIHAGEVHFAAT